MNTRPLACVAVIAAALALPACVSDAPEEAEVSESETMTAEPGSIMETGRVLQELDKRVDKYVFWKSQPGEDAARERYVERSAATSLVRLNQDALIATASDPDDSTRRAIAAKALAFSTDDRAVEALVGCLSEKGDPRLLTNATFALGELKSARTPAMPLIDLLSYPDPDVRNNTLLALFQTMEARRRAGGSVLDPIERTEAMPLIEAALFEMNDPLIRGHAAACLGSIGDPRSVDALVNLLPDPDPFVRTRTAVAIGKIGDPKAITALVAVIDETPRGTPRDAVTTALRVLVERSGRTVPPNIESSERAWTAFLKERLGPSSRDAVDIRR
jgi:HEAT repeat protein